MGKQIGRMYITCPFCKKRKRWDKFHFGSYYETTPLICNTCLKKGKVKRTFRKH